MSISSKPYYLSERTLALGKAPGVYLLCHSMDGLLESAYSSRHASGVLKSCAHFWYLTAVPHYGTSLPSRDSAPTAAPFSPQCLLNLHEQMFTPAH